MPLLSPCSAVPPPMLNRQQERPIPKGLPAESKDLLNNSSAIRSFFASGQCLPIPSEYHAPDAPKLSIVCAVLFGLMEKMIGCARLILSRKITAMYKKNF